MRHLVLAVLALFVFMAPGSGAGLHARSLEASGAAAGAETGGQGGERGPLKVLVKPVAPFVMAREGGGVQGFSIDLWHAIAARLGRESEFKMLPDIRALLAAVEAGEGDLAIAAITITAAREKRMDFSHPYFRSGLQIMVTAQDQGAFGRAFSVIGAMLAAPGFRAALMAIVLLVLVAAHVIWLVERGRNRDFTRAWPLGLWDGIYWTMVTISTVGYGDKTPKTNAGRLIALVLIVFGYVAFAWFTATISASITVSRLEGEIRGPEDLAGHAVATVSGSTSEAWLSGVPGVEIVARPRFEDAVAALGSGEAEALVYDFPVLAHYAGSAEGRGRVRLVGPVFRREPYGIAFPVGSPLREEVNRALLGMVESGEMERLERKWFGTAE